MNTKALNRGRENLASWLKRHLRSEFGLTTVDKRFFMKPHEVVEFLEENGHSVQVVYDIGAFDGNWSIQLKRRNSKIKNFILFEPNQCHGESLRAVGGQIVQEVLSENEGEAFFFSTGGTGDSIYPEYLGTHNNIVPRQITTKPLDQVVKNLNLKDPCLVKIDCQGAELDIIKGGKLTLQKSKALIVECSLLEMNKGGSTIEQIVRAATELDFHPYSMAGCNFVEEQLTQIDLVFINKKILPLNFKRNSKENKR